MLLLIDYFLAIPHLVLAVAGCIPEFGAITDLIDALLCLMEIDLAGAGFSVIGAAASIFTPGVDQGLGAVKIADAGRTTSHVADGVKTTEKAMTPRSALIMLRK